MNFTKKKKIYTTAILLMVGGVSLAIAENLLAVSRSDMPYCPFCNYQDVIRTQPNTLCSVLMASCDDNVLFGGNVDTQPQKYTETDSYIIIFPPSEEDDRYGSGYGFVVIGWDWKEAGIYYKHFPCGINEKGLAYGMNGLPAVRLNPHSEYSHFMLFQIKALRECSSVACVIELAKTVDWGSIAAQYHFADAAGDAVVISAGKNGELAFTRKNNGYLVSTNFNLANPEHGEYPCWRYETAVEMLETGDLTIGYVESVLDAIHQEGRSVNTAYSYIFDLRTGDGYVYYFHQFNEVVEFNVSVELAESTEGATSEYYYLTSLFSEETQNKAAYEFWEHQKWAILLKIGFGVAALAGFCFFSYKKLRNRTSEM